ncbi:MAG: adenosine deaminase [Pseudomonadota bacterium]|nr:adenosine deaminase [Pseudomonadota bacterium]
MAIASLPKIELHLHLEGAAPPNFIKDRALQKNIDISKIFNSDGSYKFNDFNDFLSVYETATSVLNTPTDFYDLTVSVLEESVKSNVVYSEVFISPEFCGGNDIAAWKEFLAAIREASEYCESKLGIISRGIVTCIRHLGPEVAKDAAKCAIETSGNWVVGFGMAGDESVGSPKDYVDSFRMASEAGLHLTSHAGEWGGAISVRDTIHEIGVKRIGHGVQAVSDPNLVKLIVERGIVLETCPGSNVFLGVYPSLSSHPIKKLREQGVKVTISTDDPPFFQTSMNKEYESMARTFDWNENVFVELNRVAIDAAFCDAETKEILRGHFMIPDNLL